jgi:hypothetical protein
VKSFNVGKALGMKNRSTNSPKVIVVIYCRLAGPKCACHPGKGKFRSNSLLAIAEAELDWHYFDLPQSK